MNMENRVWVIAAWEFKRFFKWRSELYTLLFMFALMFLAYGAQDLIVRLMSDEPVYIAVLQEPGSFIRSNDVKPVALCCAN